GGMEKGVMLLRGNNAQRLNPSIEGLEFELANTISALVNEDRKRVGFVTGHGELDSIQSASLRSGLSELYDVESVRLSAGQQLSGFGVLVVAKPRARFTEQDKYAMDQYLMRGGRLLMLIDQLEAAADSASRENYFAFPYALGLDDQLFRYGVRVNPDLVQDRVSLRYPVVTGVVNDKPQITPIEWPFFPLINQYANHPATRNIDASVLKFASSVDTVKAVNVRKTLLLVTSAYSRKLKAPVKVSANDLRSGDVNASLNEGPIALGYLLEGKFTSVFKNRFLPVGVDSAAFKPDGVDSKVIVIGDGDIARNEVRLRTGQPQRLGLDPFSGYTFANQELLMNLVAYLADEKGLISARSKEVKVRPLDKEKVRSERVMWQVINVVMPVVLVVLLGI
ncbi:MAG: gliding motility-associated ABC transporter substrate-binding protein GldG, partial [Cyclobacteriaceae bacterium]|nr:gliding motility-associated ABC transporter substrate-binding protein GldG [Cyclobacteriaceae bacterium]